MCESNAWFTNGTGQQLWVFAERHGASIRNSRLRLVLNNHFGTELL